MSSVFSYIATSRHPALMEEADSSSDDEPSTGRRQKTGGRHGPPTHSSNDEVHTYSVFLLGNSLEFGVSVNGENGVSRAKHVREIPVQVGSPIVHASCGLDWICLLTANGRAYSCGRNSYGQLGQGIAALSQGVRRQTSPLIPRPLLLSPGTRVAKISSGASHGGFVTESGALFMFGCSSYGRLGNGLGVGSSSTTRRTGSQHSPVQVRMQWSVLQAKVSKLNAAVSCGIPVVLPKSEMLVASDSGTRALVTEETSDNEDEVLFVDISCGDRHTLVLGAKTSRTDGGGSGTHVSTSMERNSIISFGDGMNGRLGIGNEFDQGTGALLTTFTTQQHTRGAAPKITAIAAGSSHNAALASSGELFTWGNGADGQLGHGGCSSEWVPRQVDFFRSIALASVKCGARHTLAITRTGAVYTWGRGLEGQLGVRVSDGSCAMLPQRVNLVVDPLAVHQMAIDAQIHAAAATPSHSSGTNGAATAQQHLQQQDLRVAVRSIAASANVCMALDEHARLFSWGSNADQQLGFPPEDTAPTTNRSRDKRSLAGATTEVESPLSSAACTDVVLAPRQLLYTELLDACSGSESLARQALVHFDASECFTMLVFKTDAKSLRSGSNGCGQSRLMAATASNEEECSFQQRQQHDRSAETDETELSSTGAIGEPGNRSWQLLLHHELRVDDVPSKESAYYEFMKNYKVCIRSTRSVRMSSSRCLSDVEQCHYDIGERQLTAARSDQGHQPRPTDRRSSSSQIGPPSPRQATQPSSEDDKHSANSPEAEDAGVGDTSNQKPPRTAVSSTDPPSRHVRGMESWLEKRSPTKARAQRAFGVAERFRVKVDVDRSNTLKVDEVQQPAWATAASKSAISSTRTSACSGEAGADVRQAAPTTHSGPQSTRPKSAFGRTLHAAFASRKVSMLAPGDLSNNNSDRDASGPPRKPHSNQVAPSRAAAVPPSARASKPVRAASANATSRLKRTLKLQLEQREREMYNGHAASAKRSLAAFGSSTKSRFAAGVQLSAVEATTPLHPETSTPLVYATSPRFSMGSGEHYSMIIARRLAHARGPTPGPGTYDRRGG